MSQTNAIYIQNAKTDVISPSKAMTEITCIIADMLEDNLLYVKKNGHNVKSIASRERLLKLLNITETFNQVSSDNAALKTYNDQLLREIKELKNYKKEVERQENLSKAI